MFTGIVEAVGKVLSIESRGGALHLAVELGKLAAGTKPGDSIAVAGPCLTVAGLSGSAAHFDAVAETVGRTTLSDWRAGREVNLERAVAAGARLGGHFVAGHVDGRVRALAVRTAGGGAEMDFSIPAGCGKYVAEKGSVALDGVSLTVARLLSESSFRAALVPHTLGATTLGKLQPGDEVNFEADILARYAARLLGKDAPGGTLTEEKLREHGFA
jgi:riboflavin synthase